MNLEVKNITEVIKNKYQNNLEGLDSFLENEKQCNKNDQWSKLNKCEKIKKLSCYCKKYIELHNLGEEEETHLYVFFKDLLDKKMLSRVKDVIYDKDSGFIKEIPGLLYNKTTKRFTIKNNVYKQTTTNTLKSLAPRKKILNSTIKHSTTLDITTPQQQQQQHQNKNQLEHSIT